MNKIGKYSYSPTELVIHYEDQANLTVGKFCSFGHNVQIFLGGDHRIDWVSSFPLHQLPFISKQNKDYPGTKGDVTIGNDVWVGMGAVIMSGVTIGDGATIGAYSVVRRNVGPYQVWIGNPAFLIKYRFNEFEIKELLKLKWWDWDEETLKHFLPLLQSREVLRLVDEYNGG